MARCIIAGVMVTYLLAVFQATLGARLAVAGVAPDLLFVWTICLGLLTGPRVGALVGFGAGVLEGSLRQALIAALGISKGFSGFAAGLLATKMFRENWLVPALSAGLLTLLNEIVFLLASRHDAWTHVGRLIGGRALYHAVLTPIAFALIIRARQALLGQQAEAG
ncbi:MAG TPA: LytS/YhcK type 5TM receptor domain-containing protein [Armatimonadota bacterium]|nr:LytS/YhcK type 5TM receptor domain-containing protein [Armatimonadota bacterium]